MIKVTLFVFGVFAPICLLAVPFHKHAADTKSPRPAVGPNDEVQALEEPRDFSDFLGKCFKRPVLEYTIKPLTKFGDNFGSALQALEVKLSKSNQSNEIETVQLVIKKMLPGPVTIDNANQFSKEVHFYADIIPALEQSEKAANIPESERIDAFPRYFCSRLSLNSGAVNVDSDALTILENLKSINYVGPSGFDRLNKKEIFASLKKLAKIHAMFIATRRLQPNLYYSKIDPYLVNIYDARYVKQIFKRVEALITKVPANFTIISSELRASIENAKTLYKKFHINPKRVPDTPYTTLYHGDLWRNNIMTKKSDNATTPVQVKVLDFQRYCYGSFAIDLMVFILSNSRDDDLRTDFKPFIDFYIAEFVKMLRLSNCPLDDYTNEKMWNEIRDKAKISLSKIYATLARDKVVSLDISAMLINSGIVTEDFYYDHPTPEAFLKQWKCATDLYVENGLI